MKAFVEKNKHMIKHIRVLTCNSPLLNKHMKAFFSKKIKHIAHEGFCRKKLAQYVLSEGFCQKAYVLVKKNECTELTIHVDLPGY